MSDKVFSAVLTFDGEAGSIKSVVAGIKNEVRAAVNEIEQTTKKVVLFGNVEKDVTAAAAALAKARASVDELKKSIEAARSVGSPTGELEKQLKAAQTAAAAATREFDRQAASLTKLENQLTKAGVDTRNLAAEQTRLAQAHKLAAAAAAEHAAKEALGLKTLSDIQPRIDKIRAAYETLRTSGKLSGAELAAAQDLANKKIKEAQGEVSKLSGGISNLIGGKAATEIVAFAGRFLGVTAAIGTATAAVSSSITAAKEYEQGLAEIGTVSNLTKAQLDALGTGARALSVELGLDLRESLKALFELIRSGVSQDNALEVLRVSAIAAKASLTDIGTTSRVAGLLIDGFGLEVSQLGGAFDALIQGSKDGGATLKEFADNAGPLLNVARAAKIPFSELVTVLTIMTDASNDAAGSASTLTKIILRLGDPEVRGKLRALGIEGTSLVSIFRQLAERGIPLQQFIDLGIATGKSAVGVAALTNNAKKLPDELERIAQSAGAAAAGAEAFFDSPKGRAERFNAAISDAEVNIGQLFGAGSKLAQVGTAIVTEFNEIFAAFREASRVSKDTKSSWLDVAKAFLQVSPAASEAARAQQAAGAAAKGAADQADAAATKLDATQKKLAGASTSLLDVVKELQAAASRDISDINARADAEIAALDRSAKAQAETARASVAIEQKRAADRLAVIQRSEQDITEAVNAAIKARTLAASEADKASAKFQGENTKLRADALREVVKLYTDHYNALVALGQNYAAQVNAVERERVAFARDVERQLFEVRLSGLSAIDQYVAKVQEADRLISESRKAAVNGDIDQAKRYLTEALDISRSLTTVVNKDGATVVGQYQVQATKLRIAKEEAQAYAFALDQQDKYAKEGGEATKKAIDEIKPKLTDLRKELDGLQSSLAGGLDLKAVVDLKSVADAEDQLNELARDRDVTIRVKYVEATGDTVPIPRAAPRNLPDLIPRELNRGGFALPPRPRAFAGGGLVFPSLSGSKVPGVGDSDSVPASLPRGSFVLRKAASLLYGDRTLARLARGYASGGLVNDRGLFGGAAPFGIPQRTTYQSFFESNQSGEYIGDVQAGTAQSVRTVGELAPPKLPSDPKELLRRVLAYANEVVVAARPESRVFGRAIDELNATLREYERRPDQDTLMRALQVARAIGLNLGITKDERTGFDIDGRRWHKEPLAGTSGRSLFGPLGLSPDAATYSFYAKGGEVDTVPAMLTPGEWVIRPEAVKAISRMFGGGFLPALNSMKIAPSAFDGVRNFAPPQPHPAVVARFARGGPVGNVGPQFSTAGASFSGGGLTVNIYTQKLDERTVRREVIPVIARAQRRGK